MMTNPHARTLENEDCGHRVGFQLPETFQRQKQPFLRHTPGSGVLGGRALPGMALKRAPRLLGDQRIGWKGRASPGRDWHPSAPLSVLGWAFLRHGLIGASSEPGAGR